MAEKLLLKQQITLTLDGKKRFGGLYFEPEYQQLVFEQDPNEIATWERLGFTPWRVTHLTNGVPYFVPGNCVEIYDFNHTAGVAGQLEKLGIGRVTSDRALDRRSNPENPRRIKILALDRGLISDAQFRVNHPPRDKRANPWRTPAPH